jgi:hypothetical protein
MSFFCFFSSSCLIFISFLDSSHALWLLKACNALWTWRFYRTIKNTRIAKNKKQAGKERMLNCELNSFH